MHGVRKGNMVTVEFELKRERVVYAGQKRLMA